jgi:hypothetical protein
MNNYFVCSFYPIKKVDVRKNKLFSLIPLVLLGLLHTGLSQLWHVRFPAPSIQWRSWHLFAGRLTKRVNALRRKIYWTKPSMVRCPMRSPSPSYLMYRSDVVTPVSQSECRIIIIIYKHILDIANGAETKPSTFMTCKISRPIHPREVM